MKNKEKIEKEKISPSDNLQNKLKDQTKKVAESGQAVRGQAFTWIDESTNKNSEKNLDQNLNDSNLPGSCNGFFANDEDDLPNKKNNTNQIIKNMSKKQPETEIYKDRQSSQRDSRRSARSIKEVIDREDVKSMQSSNSRFKENYKEIKQRMLHNALAEPQNHSFSSAGMLYDKSRGLLKKPEVTVGDGHYFYK